MDSPTNVHFNFAAAEHYGDGDIGIPFTATVDCELNFAIYKGDYYGLSNTEHISISERNSHYFDADQTYTISIEGVITLMLDPTDLENEDISDKDLEAILSAPDTSTEIISKAVEGPAYTESLDDFDEEGDD